MTTRLLFAAAAAACLFATGAVAATSLSTTLSGAAEKPKPGDPDGKGTATVKIDAAKGEVCYDIAVSDIGVATMAHIHKAGPDAAGPPVVPLKAPGADGKVKDCATASAEVVKDILQNPAGYYVNGHNAEFKGGAVRGQLSK